MRFSKVFKNISGTILVVFVILLVTSCFGLNLDIVLNQNGSGNVTVEYRISKYLDSLGKLDGNERWNTLPVGKADFERTMERLSGIELVSFSSREDTNDLLVTAKMEFQTIEALLLFLDPSGRGSSFSGNGSSGRMVFNLSKGNAADTPLTELIEKISASYTVNISMSFEAEGNLVLLNNREEPLDVMPSGAEVTGSGGRVSCSLPLGEILASEAGIKVEFRW